MTHQRQLNRRTTNRWIPSGTVVRCPRRLHLENTHVAEHPAEAYGLTARPTPHCDFGVGVARSALAHHGACVGQHHSHDVHEWQTEWKLCPSTRIQAACAYTARPHGRRGQCVPVAHGAGSTGGRGEAANQKNEISARLPLFAPSACQCTTGTRSMLRARTQRVNVRKACSKHLACHTLYLPERVLHGYPAFG
jgi:hypothetical protein